ncbi:nitrilase-related carbon-nitrogen hydrolase, partial [Sphingomonas sp.]
MRLVPRLALVLAQLDQTVGDPRANARALLAARASAPPGTHLVVTPELSLLGYPPEDLVLHEALIAAAEAALGDLVDATGDGGPALLIGTARPTAAGLTNAMVLAGGGHILGETHKEVLPNEGVFDEKRLFVPGRAQRLDCPADGGTVGLGVLVCEDMWTPGPARALAAAGAELFLVTNGSPFEPDKAERRL